MKIHLIGDAARQAPIFARDVPGISVSPLPRDAAFDPQFDDQIGADDIVVTLRFRRPKGAPSFRLLHVQGAGLDGIDFQSLREGCTVCNVYEHESPIAEYVLMHMLQWEIQPATMSFSAGAWGDAFRGRTPHGELAGRTVAIVGFGRIGRAVARRARAFGMRVATLDRSLDAEALELVDDRVPASDLPRLLSLADYVVLSCPLTEKTRGIIDAAALAAMKPSAVLINVARAEVVDQHALYDALSATGLAARCSTSGTPCPSERTIIRHLQTCHCLTCRMSSPLPIRPVGRRRCRNDAIASLPTTCGVLSRACPCAMWYGHGEKPHDARPAQGALERWLARISPAGFSSRRLIEP